MKFSEQSLPLFDNTNLRYPPEYISIKLQSVM